MSRKTSYSVLLAIVLVYSICCLPIVKASGATLHRDVLLVNDSTQNLEDPAADNTAQYDYTADNAELQQVDSTVNPVNGGLRGILYYRGDACGNDTPTSYVVTPSGLQSQRIALISSSVSCSIYDQLSNVQNEKAIGAIIFKSADDTINNLPAKTEAQINIPAFIVSHSAGQDLLNTLTEFHANMTANNPAGYEVIRVIMVPAQSGFGSVWQIAILVVGCLLAVSFLISVGVHFRLYQLRRRERTEIVAQQAINSSSKLDVYTLSEPVVKKFPTIVYHKASDVRISVFGSVGRRESSARDTDGRRDSTRSITFDPKRIGEKSMTEEDFKNEICAICLEEFDEGETLRQLPKCAHLFHTECIDRWLTTKSSQCPLCKRDCTPEEVMKKRQKAEQLQSRLSNLYTISNSNFSYREFDNEAYDNQRNSTFGRILGWFGHGDSSGNGSDVHTRPQGNDPIQSLSPVAVRPVNVNRVV